MALRNSPFELLTRCSFQREPEVGGQVVTGDDHGPKVPIKDREGARLPKGGIMEPGEECEEGKGSQGGELTGVSDFEWCVMDYLPSAAFLPGFFPAECNWERKGKVMAARPQGQPYPESRAVHPFTVPPVHSARLNNGADTREGISAVG